MLSTRDLLPTYRCVQTGSEEVEKILQANGNQKKAVVTILILDTIDFTVKTATRNKEGHYIMIKDQSKKI